MPGSSVARRFLRLPCQGTINRHIETSHSPTPPADEAMMRQCDGLEPVKPASSDVSAHKPVFREHPRVSMDGARTGISELLSHLVEQPLSRRAGPGRSKDCEEVIVLSALASWSRHAVSAC